MSATFELIILTPEKNFLETNATEVVFGTPEGRLGIMAGHMPMIAAVAECELEILIDGSWKTAVVGKGLADIRGEKVEFFVDTVEWASDIDAVRARDALRRAELRMKSGLSRVEQIRTQAAMARAFARIKAAEKDKK